MTPMPARRRIATDPPKSEAQRRAMWAAASGHSNIGIPQSVGKEFAEADPGGKLPESKTSKDMEPGMLNRLGKLLMEFFQEEAAEPEHQGGGVPGVGMTRDVEMPGQPPDQLHDDMDDDTKEAVNQVRAERKEGHEATAKHHDAMAKQHSQEHHPHYQYSSRAHSTAAEAHRHAGMRVGETDYPAAKKRADSASSHANAATMRAFQSWARGPESQGTGYTPPPQQPVPNPAQASQATSPPPPDQIGKPPEDTHYTTDYGTSEGARKRAAHAGNHQALTKAGFNQTGHSEIGGVSHYNHPDHPRHNVSSFKNGSWVSSVSGSSKRTAGKTTEELAKHIKGGSDPFGRGNTTDYGNGEEQQQAPAPVPQPGQQAQPAGPSPGQQQQAQTPRIKTGGFAASKPAILPPGQGAEVPNFRQSPTADYRLTFNSRRPRADATAPMYRGRDEVPATTLSPNSGPPMAAGVACTTKDGRVLLMRRKNNAADYAGTWDLPGGWLEDGEDAVEAARRELAEECGLPRDGVDTLDLNPVHRHIFDDVDYAMFATPVGEGFRPFPTNFRDPEHTAHVWAPIDDLPPDTHPGLQKGFNEALEQMEAKKQPGPDEGAHNVTGSSGGGSWGSAGKTPATQAPQVSIKDSRRPRLRRFNRDQFPPEAREAARRSREANAGAKQPVPHTGGGAEIARPTRPGGAFAAKSPPSIPRYDSKLDNAANVVRGRIVAKDAIMALDWAGVVVMSPRVTDDPNTVEFAFDRVTNRNYDKDGFLHVQTANISKGNVCPYRGSEIPDADKLGLDPNKEYMLWRHPDELKKAAPTFNGKPILAKHVPVDSSSIDPSLIVGTTGRDAHFDGTYLTNSLDFWPQNAIDGIETSVKKQLSCGYRYTADMRPGKTPQGTPYDGIMRNIVGNHVALVPEGRAGPDVVVGDSASPRARWGGRRYSFRRVAIGVDAWQESQHPRGQPGNKGQFGPGGAGGGGKTKPGKAEANVPASPGKAAGKLQTGGFKKPEAKTAPAAPQQAPGTSHQQLNIPAGKSAQPTRETAPASTLFSKAWPEMAGLDPSQRQALAKQFTQEYVAGLDDERRQAIEGTDAKLGELFKAGKTTDRLFKAGKTTDRLYKVDGKYTPERSQLHDDIIFKTLLTQERVAAAMPAAGAQPEFVIIGGRAGSGKSWFTQGRKGAPESHYNPKEEPLLDQNKYVLLDSDAIKAELPGYEGWNAGLYHEEASDILERVITVAREMGLNTILDGTMKTYDTAKAKVDAFKEKGYSISGHYMFAPPARAAANTVERFRTRKGDWSGRYVPPSYTIASLTNEQSFDQLRGDFDNWSVYDNSEGFNPQLFASSKGEQKKVM